jgi:signal transduction histidine kinase/CheY-like chemotaxis protein
MRRTLFWKYAAYFSCLVSALLVLSGGLAGYFAYRQAVASLEALQRAKARFVATEIENFVDHVEDGLRSAVRKFAATGSVDTENVTVELVALLRHHPSVTELRWISADGYERVAISRIEQDDNASGRSWLADAGYQATRTGIDYAGPLYFRKETEPYISLGVTRERGGHVLIAEVNLKFLSELIAKSRVGPTDTIYVIDSEGRLVSHADPGLALRRIDLSVLPQVRAVLRRGHNVGSDDEPHSMEGPAVIATDIPIERLGWTVFAEQSRSDAFRPVDATIATSIALVVLGVIAAIVASLILARRMIRPIREITAGAREIGQGNLEQRIDLKTGDELESLGKQFNHMAERLQTIYATQEARIAERTRALALANEAKSRFLAGASHDLRQPMHALALFVGQLRASAGSSDAPALLDKVEHSVEALQKLLEELLDLSKLDMGAVTAQTRAFALNDLLSRLVTQYAPVAEARGLALTLVPTSLWVCSDAVLLDRILSNVIANAIGYTNDGRVLVGCRRHSDEVDVVIADTGIGIHREHLPLIFDEFYRVAPTDATRGMGLGLAIVKRLTSLLNHEVAVQSVVGKGTLVRVRVPRAVPQADDSAPSREHRRDLSGSRVLVVDDEPESREAIEGLLRQWGYDVATAAGSVEALERIEKFQPDAVLCDLNLAAENGLDVVEQLRRRHGVGLACAFVTGESAPEAIAEVRARGYPIAFKPTKPATLRALVEYLSQYR